MRIMKYLVLLIIVILAGTVVLAQDSLNYGDTVEGTLEAGQRGEYTFTGSAGDVVSVRLESSDFDSYLYLLGPDGSELMVNDDGGGGLDSLISGYELPADGTYTIQASSYSDTGAGAFTLSLETFELQVIEYGQRITLDSSMSGSAYTFNADVGDIVTVSLRASDGFDNRMEMNGPDGSQYYSDYIDGRNTRISPFEVEAKGAFVITAFTDSNATMVVERIQPVELVVGEPVDITFDDSPDVRYFSIVIENPLPLDIVVDSGSMLDTRMDLYNPYDYIERSVDDGVGTVDPVLEAVLLDTEGTYYLVLEPANPNANLTGEATITLAAAQMAELGAEPVALSFNYEQNESFFAFEAEAGERIEVVIEIVESEDWTAPTVELVQNGETFANFNGSGLSRFTIDVEIPEAGTVNLFVRVYSEAELTIELNRITE